MEKILYTANLCGFKTVGKSLCFSHGENEINIPFDTVEMIKLESNMSAKAGAYVSLELDADDKTVMIDSEHAEFFDFLFDILCVELDVDMEEVFNISVANTKTEKIVYLKK